jgi:N12 class adenine-specific DNA methylase
MPKRRADNPAQPMLPGLFDNSAAAPAASATAEHSEQILPLPPPPRAIEGEDEKDQAPVEAATPLDPEATTAAGDDAADAARKSAHSAAVEQALDELRSAELERPLRGFRCDDLCATLPAWQSSERAGRQLRIDANFEALRLLNHLEEHGRDPTETDQRILARYSGWGGLAEVFTDPSQREELVALVGESTVDELSKGVLNAHFTPPAAVAFVWDALQRLGVRGGRILEPACGILGFAALAPSDWRTAWTAVDIDGINARIASQLYPDARVLHSPFEQAQLPDNFFDVVVGNVPFGSYQVYDPETPELRMSVHNAVIHRALRKLKPGGTLAVLTSTFTLDATRTDAARTHFHRLAEFVAAFRLPADLHEWSASTRVSVDLLILRRRALDVQPAETEDRRWLDATFREMYCRDGAYINNYIHETAHAAIGDLRVERGVRGRLRWGTTLTGDNPIDRLRQFQKAAVCALATLPQGACAPNEADALVADNPEPELTDSAAHGIPAGRFFVSDEGILRYSLGRGETAEVPHTGQRRERLIGMLKLRESIESLLDLQAELGDSAEDEARVAVARSQLAARYDLFVSQFGAVNRAANRQAFADDRGLPLVLAMEEWDEDSRTAKPAAILQKRTLYRVSMPVSAETVAEAVPICMAVKGHIDVEYLASLVNRSRELVEAELLAENLAFRDPNEDRWEHAPLYLSGDIEAKIAAAEAAEAEDPTFARNVRALQAVRQPRVPAEEIWIVPGSPFVRTEDLVGFIANCRDGRDDGTTVDRIPGLRRIRVRDAGSHVNDTTQWGTPAKPLPRLLEDMANGATSTVYREVEKPDGTTVMVVDHEATMLAREKTMVVREEFARWVLSNPQRRSRIEDEYNKRFNNLVPAVYDGSHLRLPGLSAIYEAGRHQKDAIWRGIMGDSGVFHVVGAGKTLVAAAIAMESRRLGLRRKPCFTVPNHLVGKTAGEFLSYYPRANLLVIDRDAFQGQRRRVMTARIATGDFDAVIIAHSTFGKIVPSPESAEAILDELASEIDAAIDACSDRQTLKQLHRSRRALEAAFERFVDRGRKRQDDHLDFDALGIDLLLVDESQAFKNLFFSTARSRVAGLSNAASLRALDMFIKTRSIQRRNREKGGMVFLTGTPIANTLAEMFHVMRYLAMPLLRAKGIDTFDSWAALFGEVVAALEVTPEGGGFRINERFARFRNLPELMQIFSTFADVRTREDLDLPVPAVKGGGPQIIAVPASKAVKRYVESLVARAEAIRDPDPENRPKPEEDNMLLVCTDGRKAALDLRLVRPGARDDPASKVNVAVGNIFRIWQQSQGQRLTQLVFCDMGTPGGATFDVYADLKRKLIARGVPPEEIAFAHDAKTERQRLQLYARVNRGLTRILLGSTPKMGTGTNVQCRLYAKHDLDAPWRPDEVEQRDGRVIRPGNSNPVVELYRYVTEGTFDAYTWQLLEHKARFINMVMSGKCRVRSMEDVEARVLTYVEVKAAATGNPLIIERAKLQAEAQQLRSLSRAHHKGVIEARVQHREIASWLEWAQKHAAAIHRDAQRLLPTTGDDFRLEVRGRAFGAGQQKEAGEALLSASNARLGEYEGRELLGAFAGFPLYAEWPASSVGGRRISMADLWFEGEARYRLKLSGESSTGAITRMRNALDLPARLTKLQAEIHSKQAELRACTALLTRPFAEQERLEAVEGRLEAVERELGIAEDSSGGYDVTETAPAENIEGCGEAEEIVIEA